MNKAALELCRGDLVASKKHLDLLLATLKCKFVVTEPDSVHALPSYVASLLIYFFLVTKNMKMARHLAKYGKFVLDTNHVDPTQQPSTSSTASNMTQIKLRGNLLSTAKAFT